MKNNYNEFHSQNGEDSWIIKNIKNLPDDGIFVDVGAASAMFRNNTYHFEKNGWTGICIDADPHWFEPCDGKCGEPTTCHPLSEYRKQYLNVAVGTSNKMVNFNQSHRHVLSHVDDVADICKGAASVVNRVEIQQRTLNDILNEYSISNIDLLSIDCEGIDFEVWDSLDLKKHPVKVLIIEFIHIGRNEFKELMDAFDDYTLVVENSCNFIYVYSG